MILLIIIYAAFISLGLPDALLGSSWTIMHQDVGASIEFAGMIAMIISGGTIISSLFSSKIIRQFGTGKVVVTSVMMTAVALIGFSISNAVWMLIIFSIPLGLGAGSIDAALNNFVALHYKPRHMNWLHCFWGVGAAGGPLILSYWISRGGTWINGYQTVGILQWGLVVVLFFSLPLWRAYEKDLSEKASGEEALISNRHALQIKGVKVVLITFLFYCALEVGTGLWAASYLTTQRGIDPRDAAIWTSMYYGGITVGRFISGILAEKVKGENLIRGGLIIIMVGVVILMLPLPSVICMPALILIGLGCAPIYPSIIHLTPKRFGKHASQSVIGLSMAFAYIGSTFMPPLIGSLSLLMTLKVLPYVLFVFVVIMMISSEKLRSSI